MIVLGVNSFVHDSSAALLVDGRLAAAAEEERFSRVKHTAALPERAIAFCLEAAGLRPRDLDHVALTWQPWRVVLGRGLALLGDLPGSLRLLTARGAGERYRLLWDLVTARRHLERALGGPLRARLHCVRHHEAHVASAFLPSPFESAAVLSLDDRGEWETACLALGQGSSTRCLGREVFPHSLGALYSMVTQYLGFRRDGEEGKVMGLSSYGEPRFLEPLRRTLSLLPGGRFRVHTRHVGFTRAHDPYFDEALVRLLGGPPRQPGAEIEPRHQDVAASIQALIEEAVLHVARHLHRLTGARDLCLAGGVAMNSVANGRLLREGPFERLYVPPAPGDSGAALGAALAVWHRGGRRPRSWRMTHAFTGPAYDTARCLRAAEASAFPHRVEPDIAAAVADLLARGQVVGWLSGAMELGPRALGGRSILAAPHDPSMRDRVNHKVKRREPFRPFAPAVLEERAAEWFESPGPVPFMSEVHPVRAERRAALGAVTHVDGTARLQTVGSESPRFRAVLEAYGRRTGVPVVLNTSFNVRGEPIVCTPEDALRCFAGTDMDALALEDVLVTRAPRPEA